MGRWGESVAAWFLEDRGLEIVARNVAAEGGELDLLASDSGLRVAVEVRTITGAGDPIDAIGPAKRLRVRALASLVGAHRVDFVGIQAHAGGVDLHWVPD